MGRRCYETRAGLPNESNSANDRQWHKKSRPNERGGGSISRKANTEAKETGRKVRRGADRFEAGFEACVKARIDPEKQKKLYKAFYEWHTVIKSSDIILVSGEKRIDVFDAEFELRINEKYPLHSNHFIPWVYLKRSGVDGAGFGLFAARRFEAGDTVGVYMGLPPPQASEPSKTKHHNKPYLLSGVADAVGGITESPPLFGMHFINDPSFGEVRNAKARANVEAYSNGRVVALTRVYKDDEFFMIYDDELNDEEEDREEDNDKEDNKGGSAETSACRNHQEV
jgi:hypothetical protein